MIESTTDGEIERFIKVVAHHHVDQATGRLVPINPDGDRAAAIISELLAQRRKEYRFQHVKTGSFYKLVGAGLWIDNDLGEDMMDLAIRERSPGVYTAENAVPVEGYHAGRLQCAVPVRKFEGLVVYRAEIDGSWWARSFLEFHERFRRFPGQPDATLATLNWLRSRGWMVAVHNDYRQDGRDHTFWLFTHPSGRWVKGEGDTDELALAQCRGAADAVDLHLAQGMAK